MTQSTMKQSTKRSYERFNPPQRLLLGPGPSPVDDRVLTAMAAPVLGHLDPLFLQCMDDVQALLRYVFETENRVTIPISATGSAGMEAALVNVIEPGNEVVVCINGVFGERLADIVERAGGVPLVVNAKWGEAFDLNRIEEALASGRPRALALVHAETSTGVLQDLNGLSDLARRRDALLIVDAVTSLGGHPVGVDRNGIDICYSGTQKCIGAPPGWPPSEVTASTISRASRRRARSDNPFRSCNTPVDVSAWTNASARGRPEARASSMRLRSKASPHFAFTTRGTPPARSTMSRMRSPKTPLMQTTTSLPGSITLTKAASIPALPVAEIGMVTRFSVSKTYRSRACTSSMHCRNKGSRWPSTGAAIAAST